MAISHGPMTLEQFLEQPEAEPALEYDAGVVRQKVSPKGPHGTIQFWLGHLIYSFGGPRKLVAVFTETRVSFGGSSLVPDLIVYRWERIPLDADGRVVEDFTTPPVIAVEIVSPGQSIADLDARCRWYVEQGAPIALLVHPRREWVRLFRPRQEPVELTGDDSIDLEAVLPGFRLIARELFSALRPR